VHRAEAVVGTPDRGVEKWMTAIEVEARGPQLGVDIIGISRPDSRARCDSGPACHSATRWPVSVPDRSATLRHRTEVVNQ
jgi:hypothetical protein